MKRKLLYLVCLVINFTFAQTITTFNSEDMSIYAIVNGTVDQSPVGANTTWDFTSLTTTENSTDTYAPPTSTQTSNFPGTTNVFTNTTNTTGAINNVLLKSVAGELSITGAVTTDLELNYNVDNALIGIFPLNFGYNNSDPVAGTFTNPTISGDFSGNIVKTVDAHGALSINVVGVGNYSGTVTRLKTIQTVTLNIPFVPNAGTATQTSYYYYDNSTGNLVFRSNTVHVVVPIGGIDDTTTVNEVYLVTLLGVKENFYNELSISPNPVNSILSLNLNTPTAIKSVIIYEINGRQVLSTTDNTASLNVSTLQAGMYIIQVQTDTGMLTKKFIKN